MKLERTMVPKDTFDVVVVGGGIAGVSAALCVREKKRLGDLSTEDIERIRIQETKAAQ